MSAPKKPATGKSKMKDMKGKKVSASTAGKVTGGATGRRVEKPVK